jgi:hypothetical protein
VEEKFDCVGKFEGIGPITGTGGQTRNGTCHKPVGVENYKLALFRASAIGRFEGWTLVSSYVPPECLNKVWCIVQKPKVWLSFEQPLWKPGNHSCSLVMYVMKPAVEESKYQTH